MSAVDYYDTGAGSALDQNAVQSNISNKEAGSVGRKPHQDVRRGASSGGVVDILAPTYHIAKWKGFEFFVDTSSDEVGRRGDIYEYPLSDYIGYKDLGARASRFKLEGYLIGTDQMSKTLQIMREARSPEPGVLIHPMYGSIRVACITCTATADYRKDKKRTRLAFDFVEANESWAPYMASGGSTGAMFGAGNDSIFASEATAAWDPGAQDMQLLADINRGLGNVFGNPSDIPSFDAQDMLNRWGAGYQGSTWQGSTLPPAPAMARMPYAPGPEMIPGMATSIPGMEYPVRFKYAMDPIDYASATIRRIHTDALERLKEFNAFVVNRMERLAMPSPTAQSLIITTRLIVARDMGIAMALRTYDTVKDALDDLDRLIIIYDQEEAIATQRCDDVLVSTIRKARAIAAGAILARSIRLPGIAEFPAQGVWPSLVVAQKLYNDGRRYEQIEKYNPQMTPLFMGMNVIAPAR